MTSNNSAKILKSSEGSIFSMSIISEMAQFVTSLSKSLYLIITAIIWLVDETKGIPTEEVRGIGLKEKLPEELPSAVEIKKALPRHCFQPKTALSMYYAFRDAVQIVVCFYIFRFLHATFPSPYIYWPTMVAYWVLQGIFFTAVFILGHDCGHGTFSSIGWINDLVGNIIHSFVLVPYYPWKLSHRNHHKYTGNFEKDEVYYPTRKSDKNPYKYFLPGFGIGLAWYFYLIRGYHTRTVNHFNAYHPMFTGHVADCILSLACWSGMVYLMFLYSLYHGFIDLLCYCIIPEFIFASYIVIITFLHHTETGIAWYAEEKWSFVRGNLSTIDRDYGLINNVLHDVGTHQIHHVFSKIPHYHLVEATRHFRKAFPALVRQCDEPIMPSFVRMFHKFVKQRIIDDDVKVYYYK